VLTTSLYSRFTSRHEEDFAWKIVQAMRRAYPGSDGGYLYGPICVAAAERGRGIARALFAALRAQLPGREGIALASMGIYIFEIDVLVRTLEADAALPTTHDFGRDVIPSLIHDVPVFAYRFYDENKKSSKYWRDIGTLDAYFDANMDLCHVSPEFNLYDPEWPLRTYQPQAPPAKFVFADVNRRFGQAVDSVISPGCIVSGSSIFGSVLCPNVRVHSFCRIEQCILMPGVRVGRHARLRRAIIDRDVLIPRGALIGYNEEEDRRRHFFRRFDQDAVPVGARMPSQSAIPGVPRCSCS
jgi:ADP-glucose pyrophosphorylase